MYKIIKASANKTGLPDQSVDCVATSPPYWSMRIYDGDQLIDWETMSYSPMPGLSPITIPAWRGALGAEETPQAYVGHMVLVAREMWRVLKPTGIFWCNLGDTYAGYWGDQTAKDEGRASKADRNGFVMNEKPGFDNLRSSGLKPKDMIMIPDMVAFALRADGWFLRAACPWIKRNGTPESVESRPTTVIESIFMLAKAQRHFYDYVAVQMPVAESSIGRLSQDIENQTGSPRANGGAKTNGNIKAGGSIEKGRRRRTSDWFFESWQGLIHDEDGEPLAFVVNPKGFKAAHFATWPMELVEPMILSGSSSYGVCPKCGSPWVRIVEKSREHGLAEEAFPKTDGLEKQNGHKRLHQRIKAARAAGEDHDNPLGGSITIGWEPSCACDANGAAFLPDDFEIIETPTGESIGDDPTQATGRNGFNRPRGEDEGKRPITRYEQRTYVKQLRNSLHRKVIEQEAGSAFAHYIRLDKSGARPVPDDLLNSWIERGLIERVEVPKRTPFPAIPATILDPFCGSGTTLKMAVALGRDAIGVDLSDEYLEKLVPDRVDNTQIKMQF